MTRKLLCHTYLLSDLLGMIGSSTRDEPSPIARWVMKKPSRHSTSGCSSLAILFKVHHSCQLFQTLPSRVRLFVEYIVHLRPLNSLHLLCFNFSVYAQGYGFQDIIDVT